MAITVTLALVVALAQMFKGASDAWRRSETQVDAFREARGALQLMARDLGATLQASYSQASGTGAQTVAAPLPTLALQHHPDTKTDATGPINEEVYCLTNVSNHGSSTLCAVGYYCQWLPDFLPVPASGAPDLRPRAYALIRQSLDSNGTYLRLQTAYQNGHNPLIFLDLYSRTNTPVPSITQIAAYIWDLRFRIDTDLSDTPSTIPDGNNPPPLDHTPPSPSQPTAPFRYAGDTATTTYHPYPPLLPGYVEIRFRALSDLAAQRLEGVSSGVSQSTWNDTATGFSPYGIYKQIILPNSQQFVLRVPLVNAVPLSTPTPSPAP